jgi:membrane protein implicated in regulation of membrane protease activity
MLIAALVLAVIGLAALVTAVVTSNELIAWVCIGASVIGVLLLIVDALRERSRRDEDDDEDDDELVEQGHQTDVVEDYPDEPTSVIDGISSEDATASTAVTEDSAKDDSAKG